MQKCGMNVRRLVCVLLAFPLVASGQTTPSPADLLHESLAAMGGEQKVRALSTLHIQSSLVRSMLEQSERPEGPYILENNQVDEWRDLAHNNWKRTVKVHVTQQPEFVLVSAVSGGAALSSFDSHAGPGSGEQLQDSAEALALSPERVLITALASSDLRRLPDLILQSVPHQEVEFTWQGSAVRIFLNADTHLPTAVEWVAAYPFGIFWSIWGDVTTRVYYSLWWLQNGIHYPLQKDIFRNGLPDQTETITKIDFNPSPSADEFSITPEIRTAFAARANKTIDDRAPNVASAKEIVPGVLFFPGNWNTTLIRQDDGIVVLEAPISSGYSAKVLDFAQTKFPGVRVKAVITTSDSWPHIGGVREYVARGIPVYVLDRTVPLIERFVRAPRTKYPDSLAKTPRTADLRAVSAKITIGNGPNRVELYPIHGETSERQMMVYFPEHKLLYGSDPFQQLEDGKFFYPQTVYELQNAVEREHLPVDRFFMMHIGPNPWSMVLKTVQEAN
jgi:hypothetical protein